MFEIVLEDVSWKAMSGRSSGELYGKAIFDPLPWNSSLMVVSPCFGVQKCSSSAHVHHLPADLAHFHGIRNGSSLAAHLHDSPCPLATHALKFSIARHQPTCTTCPAHLLRACRQPACTMPEFSIARRSPTCSACPAHLPHLL